MKTEAQIAASLADLWRRLVADPDGGVDLVFLLDAALDTIVAVVARTEPVDRFVERMRTFAEFDILTQALGEIADLTPPGQAGSTLGESK